MRSARVASLPLVDAGWSEKKATYRTKSQAWIVAAAGWTCGGVVALMGLGIHDRHGHVLVGVAIPFGAVGLAFIAACTRASRSAAVVTSAGVIVRNPTRTVRLPWRSIERISLGQSGIYASVGRVHLVDGHVIRIWGIQGRKRTGDLAAERLTGGLDHWRTTVSTAHR